MQGAERKKHGEWLRLGPGRFAKRARGGNPLCVSPKQERVHDGFFRRSLAEPDPVGAVAKLHDAVAAVVDQVAFLAGRAGAAIELQNFGGAEGAVIDAHIVDRAVEDHARGCAAASPANVHKSTGAGQGPAYSTGVLLYPVDPD
jgi:hypothetical protein